MQLTQVPITGTEDQGDLLEPYQALVQFYDAFNNGNIVLMSQNWHQSDEISMDNPLGGIKRGWHETKAVYESIFSGAARVYVEFYDYTIHETSETFYAVGRERGCFKIGDAEIKLAIRTSRIFRRVDGIWKQVHHHGSIEDPSLLARYQAAVACKR